MTPDRFAPLVPFLLNGTLSRQETDRVEGHLRQCAACRALLDEARLARELGSAPPEAWNDHVQAQHLERFALDPGSTPQHLAGWIGAHVEKCDACREAVERLRATTDVDDLLPLAALPGQGAQTTEAAEEGGTAGRGREPGWFVRALLRPIPAAVYLILVLILLPLVFLRGGRPAGSAGGSAGAGPAVVDLPVLRTPLRGAAGETEIVPTGSPFTPLAIELPAESLRQAIPLRLFLRGSDGRAPVRLEVPPARVERALADSGLLVVLLPASALAPGTYEVELRRADDEGGPPLVAGTVRVVPAGK